MAWVKHDLYGNSLNNLREVPGCVVWRKKRELRSAGGRDFSYLPVKNNARKRIDPDIGRVSSSNVGQLGLFIVRLNPHIAFHQVDQLHARRYELAFLYM